MCVRAARNHRGMTAGEVFVDTAIDTTHNMTNARRMSSGYSFGSKERLPVQIDAVTSRVDERTW